MTDWVKHLPCTTCLPKLSDPLAVCNLPPGSTRCSKCYTDHKKCRPVPDSPELRRILGLRGLVYYSGMLGDDVEALQTELTALVNALHQDIREQTRNESSPVAEKARSAPHDRRVNRLTQEFMKERKRKRSMVYVRVPRLSKRRMREYKLIRDDMIAKVSLSGHGQDVSNPGGTEIVTQDQGQADGTSWEGDDAEQTPVDNIEAEKQDSAPGNDVNEIQTDDPQGNESVSFFDEDKHWREQYDEVRKMLDAMVRRSLQQNSSRHVFAMKNMTEARSTNIKAFGSLMPKDDAHDDVGLEQDVYRWLAGEHAGGLEGEDGIPGKVNNVEDNAPDDPSEITKQEKPRQKAKETKMKRKLERAERERERSLNHEQEKMEEGKEQALSRANLRQSYGDYTSATVPEKEKRRKALSELM